MESASNPSATLVIGRCARCRRGSRELFRTSSRLGPLSWELRIVTSAARVVCTQDRAADARAILQPVYDRFTEEFETADLEMAKTLLDTLQ